MDSSPPWSMSSPEEQWNRSEWNTMFPPLSKGLEKELALQGNDNVPCRRSRLFPANSDQSTARKQSWHGRVGYHWLFADFTLEMFNFWVSSPPQGAVQYIAMASTCGNHPQNCRISWTKPSTQPLRSTSLLVQPTSCSWRWGQKSSNLSLLAREPDSGGSVRTQ